MNVELNLLPIPAMPHQFLIDRVTDLRARMVSEVIVNDDGTISWKSNPSCVIPPHVFKDAYAVPSAAQVARYEREFAIFAAEYRASQPKTVSAERRAEARAAHGRGVVLVDVISGRRFRT